MDKLLQTESRFLINFAHGWMPLAKINPDNIGIKGYFFYGIPVVFAEGLTA